MQNAHPLHAPLQATLNLMQKAVSKIGGDLHDDQVLLYKLAVAQSQLEGARALLERFEDVSELANELAGLQAAQVSAQAHEMLARHHTAFAFSQDELALDPSVLACLDPEYTSALGQRVVEQGLPELPVSNEHAIVRQSFAAFARDVIEPVAEEIHRKNLLVPEEILDQLREMGCFGLSIPERFGGLNPDDSDDTVGMVIVTEELSKGSLGAAGSLITRPEIMARALLEGGTPEQQSHWLPRLASGETLCAISVTEPNAGSDVANVALRATKTQGGWLLNGGKTWCTFAGRAELILLLARTDTEASPAHKGLSLFLIEKPAYTGEDFQFEQPDGGRMEGRAIATLGYRGMHSYEMFYDNFFVPDSHLVGAEAGLGKGFYFTMRGFMGGRIQTAARANGLMRAALDQARSYTQERRVFGQPVADFPLTQEKLALMAAAILACQAHTLEVSKLIDAGEGTTEASLVKLAACKAAEWVTREALQLFGGMGYAEESAVSRYFADARVLSIFEGAEETLAIRVIGKALASR